MGFRGKSCLFTVVLGAAVLIACGDRPLDPLAVPDSPDGTVRAVMQGLSGRHPEIIWRAMPPSYQQDVNGLAARFAATMDPALFDRAIAVTRKGVAVLQSKKDLILSCESVRMSGVDTELLDGIWEGYAHALDAVLVSDLTSLEALRDLDVDNLLATTGSSLMVHISSVTGSILEADTLASRLADLETTEVELVETSGDRATVRVTPPEGSPTDVAMTRIDGRWVPSDLNTQWNGMIETAGARIDALNSEESAQARMQVRMALGMAEGLIDQLALVETSQDIDDLVGGFLGSFLPAQQGRTKQPLAISQ